MWSFLPRQKMLLKTDKSKPGMPFHWDYYRPLFPIILVLSYLLWHLLILGSRLEQRKLSLNTSVVPLLGIGVNILWESGKGFEIHFSTVMGAASLVISTLCSRLPCLFVWNAKSSQPWPQFIGNLLQNRWNSQEKGSRSQSSEDIQGWLYY